MVIFNNILIIAFNFLGLDLMKADIAETIVVLYNKNTLI
jgi:hypothetical protein